VPGNKREKYFNSACLHVYYKFNFYNNKFIP